MLTELHAERAGVDQAILVLERLASGRRGRPPACMTGTSPSARPERLGRVFSSETRARTAVAQQPSVVDSSASIVEHRRIVDILARLNPKVLSRTLPAFDPCTGS